MVSIVEVASAQTAGDTLEFTLAAVPEPGDLAVVLAYSGTAYGWAGNSTGIDAHEALSAGAWTAVAGEVTSSTVTLQVDAYTSVDSLVGWLYVLRDADLTGFDVPWPPTRVEAGTGQVVLIGTGVPSGELPTPALAPAGGWTVETPATQDDTTAAVAARAPGEPVALHEITTTDEDNTLTLTIGAPVRGATTQLALGLSATTERRWGTDTKNRAGGRVRTGVGVAEWDPPVEPDPDEHPTIDAVIGDDEDDNEHPQPGGSPGIPAHLTTAPTTATIAKRVVTASAYGPATMNGAQPEFTVSTATKPATRQRIIIGGKDVTYFRGIRTPDAEYELMEPLLWGPATITFPQIQPAFEKLGTGKLKWLKPGARVKIQRVLAGNVVATTYRGIVIAYDTNDAGLAVEIGGHASGRAALRDRPVPIIRRVYDVGQYAWQSIVDMGLKFTPRMGPNTGIKIANFGGSSELDYLRELCAKAWTRDGTQWTIMPNAKGVYRMRRKDTETIDFTVFPDDAKVIANLRRDIAEEPNRIFATGVTPEGQRVRFGAYPGLKQTRAPKFPMPSGELMEQGTTNADTTTGSGVTVLINRLAMLGYLDVMDMPGGYDRGVAKAVKELQEDADLEETGKVGKNTWAALWDLDVTGFSLRWSKVLPAAQRSYTRKYKRAPSGAVIGKNPKYDRSRLVVDRTVDMGPGFKRSQIREWARAELQREDNWVGTITIKTGAVLEGDVPVGATVTPEMLMGVNLIKPGMNARLPQWQGGVTVHVSGVTVRPGEVVLAVDTQARDALEVWEVITRNREARSTAARLNPGRRSSMQIKDAVDQWDEVGGVLGADVTLAQGWNVFPVVAGQEGTVSRMRLQLGQPAEFATAVFGRKVTPARLNGLLPSPLSKKGSERWEKPEVVKQLEDLWLVYAAGTHDEPCGYSPGRKAKGVKPTGVHADDGGFAYRTTDTPVLWIAVYVTAHSTLPAGRVLWPLLEAGV